MTSRWSALIGIAVMAAMAVTTTSCGDEGRSSSTSASTTTTATSSTAPTTTEAATTTSEAGPLGSISGTADAMGDPVEVSLDLLAVVRDANRNGECRQTDMEPGSTVVVGKVTVKNPNSFALRDIGAYVAVANASGNRMDASGAPGLGDVYFYVSGSPVGGPVEIRCNLPQLEKWKSLMEGDHGSFVEIPGGSQASFTSAVVVNPSAAAEAVYATTDVANVKDSTDMLLPLP